MGRFDAYIRAHISIPRTTCASYHRGHTTHWVPALRSTREPVHLPVDILAVDGYWLTFSIDGGEPRRGWTHDHSQLARGLALADQSGRVTWEPRLRVLSLHGPGSSIPLLLADEPSTCLR